MSEYYLLIKSCHIVSVICWMAGMLYLPRLFVYHTENKENGSLCSVFEVMENKLLRYIINPSMIFSFIFGILLIYILGFSTMGSWIHWKMFMLILMTAVHGILSRHRKQLSRKEFKYSSRYYRYLNEIPSILMIVIVCLAVIKPS